MRCGVTRSEWAWALAVSSLVLLMSCIPYLTGYAVQTPEWAFGGAVFDRPDYNVHLASIQSGLRGEWQYPMLHTSENAGPAYVKLFYIVVGQVGRWLPLSASALYQGARLVCGLWMLLTMYVFAACFLWPVVLRRTAFLLLVFGSGLGWLMLLLRWQPSKISPIDFWMMDLYGFFSLLTFPHFSAMMALLWTAALAFLAHWSPGASKGRWLVTGVIASVLAQAIQPFAPLILDTILAGYAVWGWLRHRKINWREVWSLAILGMAQLPLLVYSTVLFQGDPVWQSFTRQNLTLSPPPIYYLLGLGLPGVLALWGGWLLAQRRWSKVRLLLVWTMGVAILIYLPTQFQRRFTEAVMGPVAVLAVMGLSRGVLRHSRKLRRWLARTGYPYRRARGLMLVLILIAAMPSSLYLVFGGALITASRSVSLFDSGDVVQAVDWLGSQSDWQAAVFSAERTGSLIPARIGHRVYLGHPIETADYAAKSENVKRFFGDAMTDAERQSMLREGGCRFVFYSPAERALGTFRPDTAGFLRLRYSNATVKVYELSSE